MTETAVSRLSASILMSRFAVTSAPLPTLAVVVFSSKTTSTPAPTPTLDPAATPTAVSTVRPLVLARTTTS